MTENIQSTQCINEIDILCLGCQYTDFYFQLICLCLSKKFLNFDIIQLNNCCRCSQLRVVSR